MNKLDQIQTQNAMKWQQQCLSAMNRATLRSQQLYMVLPNVVTLYRIRAMLACNQSDAKKRLSNKSLLSLIEQKQFQHAQKQNDLLNAASQMKLLQLQQTKLNKQSSQAINSLLKSRRKLQQLAMQSDQMNRNLQTVTKLQQQQRVKDQQVRQKYNKREKQLEQMKKRIEQLAGLKRKLNSQLQQLKGNIRVYCRVRPFLYSDPPQQCDSSMINIQQNQLLLRVPDKDLKTQRHTRQYKFSYQHIFQSNSCQADIFNQLTQLVQSALDGKDVCIFAYGQTGSGKTYTMQGGQMQSQGIIPRTALFIFNQASKAQVYGFTYKLYSSVQQVYCQQLIDLLGGIQNGQKRIDNQVKMEYTQLRVNTLADIQHVLNMAQRNRRVAETGCNQHSSRSHCIFKLRILGQKIDKDKFKDKDNKIEGTLNLIDLAGSQRVGQSKVEGQRFKQTASINKSLTTLSQVICAMSLKQKKKDHIPFRNSKLTRVLKPHLQGEGSKTLMLVNISPLRCNFHPTLCALRFAQDVKRMRNSVSPIKGR